MHRSGWLERACMQLDVPGIGINWNLAGDFSIYFASGKMRYCLRHRYMQRCRIRYDIHSPRAAAHLEWLHISNARRISSIPPGMDIDQFEKLQFATPVLVFEPENVKPVNICSFWGNSTWQKLDVNSAFFPALLFIPSEWPSDPVPGWWWGECRSAQPGTPPRWETKRRGALGRGRCF